jgi:hypothetical protein
LRRRQPGGLRCGCWAVCRAACVGAAPALVGFSVVCCLAVAPPARAPFPHLLPAVPCCAQRARTQAWCCATLYAALCRLASQGGHTSDVLALLDQPRMVIPELVAIGLSIVNKRDVMVRPACRPAPRSALPCPPPPTHTHTHTHHPLSHVGCPRFARVLTRPSLASFRPPPPPPPPHTHHTHARSRRRADWTRLPAPCSQAC